jgi:S1-C subfamily serine protease
LLLRGSLPAAAATAAMPTASGDGPEDAHEGDDRGDDIMFFFPDQRGGEEERDDSSNELLSQVLDSILKVHCTHSEPDNIIPWQRIAQSTSTSSGFVIGDRLQRLRVMTNAHSVEYGSVIQVQRRGEEIKYGATIEAFCNECDLAILRVDDPNFWQRGEELTPLEFGPLPALQDEVEVLGYPTGGDSLSITQGVVSRIEMQEYTQASSHLLAIQIDAAINAGNSGGPVVNRNLQVIGVAFQGLEGAENIGYVVPVTVVQHILQDIQRNRRYTGFCSLGVDLELLENAMFRKSLGMLDDQDENRQQLLSGIMVRKVKPTSAAKGILHPNDVILQVDSIKVGNDGKIPFRRGERVALACYIQTKIVGDKVRVKVLREGSVINLDVPVGISNPLVPTHWMNRPPPYIILGGFVFTALSVPYLYASGAWNDYVSDNMSYLLGLRHGSLERETDQVVILIQVLAHRKNLGYDKLTDLHLERINGTKVRSLRHLKRLVGVSQDEFLRFEFAPENRIVVLERTALEDMTREVCEEHSIRRAFYLHDDGNESSGESASDDDVDVMLAADVKSKVSLNFGSSDDSNDK